ncbi:iron ABC transporter permease (plasmid) [Diaphorobacter sp. HDW4B]|uniref:FecCD family ABC transporter permease n=1 Tax=Diaphorobacter sp. HDW4B TaxID=2714925 RepID=UPI00140AE4A3|nr:iron ABC transporter permease [Diaphorobacter sp. HDW4B]
MQDFAPASRLVWIVCTLIALLMLLTGLSLFVGYVDIGPLRLVQGALAGDLVPQRILLDIRLPRTILCVAVGATLGLTGAAMQGLLRNPLAEPGLLGVSSGAALGAVLALYTGFANAFYLALPLSGFAGTALACAFVFALAGSTTHRTTLILGGVAVSSLCGALISLILNWSSNPLAMSEIVFWMMGSLADRSHQDLLLALPFMVLGCGVLLSCGTALRALALGEDTAHSMGVNLGRLRMKILLGAALAVGASVSVSGSIGFIGLVAPHLMRRSMQGDPARLLPVSALAGAVLLLLADLGVRFLYNSGQELKLGVLTSLVGAPFFLALILRRKGNEHGE